MTFHEVGVNARTCFNGFFSASEPKKSLLLKSFCFYHFDFPGCEVDVPQHERGGTSCTSSSRGGGSGNDGSEEEVLSLNDVSLQVGEAMKHLNIKQALGMGVGSGAYILTKTALAFPKAFAGLVLFAPCCKKATWWEYMFGKVLLKCLWYYGWNSKFAHTHLYQRLFSSATNAAAQDGYGVSELLYTFNQEVEKIDPRSIWKYLRAVLDREDILDDVKNLKSRVLLFLCVDSIYKHESLEMNLRLQHNIADYIEVFDSGTLITEQLPQVRSIDN